MTDKLYKRKLFGLRKKQINQFFHDLKKSMSMEKRNLLDDISYWNTESERAERQIVEMEKALMSRYADDELELAKKRVPTILSWMDKQSEQEINQVKAAFDVEIECKKKELERIELEIKNGSELLQRLITQFTKGIEHLNDFGEIEETLSKEFSFEGEKNRDFFIPQPITKNSFEPTSDFWEDSEAFLSKMSDYQKLEIPPLTPKEQVGKSDEEIHVMNDRLKDDQENESSMAQKNEGPFKNTKVIQPSTVSESEGIKQEIDHIKKRYIVGKQAGKDLYGSKGELIIKKNDMITEDVVVKANREGMLADLIVHMKIPGIGESHNE